MTDQPFTKFAEVWPLCGEASQAIFTATRPFVDPIVNETGLTQPRVVHTLLVARAIEPDAISPERICRRYPYGTLASWAQPMETLAERQLLDAQGNGSYRLTPGGRAIITRLLKEFYAGLVGIEKSIEPVYPAADLDRLAALLTKIVTASFNASIERSCLKDSHGLVPNGNATTLARIDQALDDLNAFRDDAHLTAWQPLQVTGEAWELFTFLWRSEVKNADEMVEKVTSRGHSREAYQFALGDLIGRGWVRAAGENAFEVTATGRQVREEAEAATDRNFYTPWQVLNKSEVKDLNELLTRLKTALAQTVEAAPA
jgi:Helix-turn-helix family